MNLGRLVSLSAMCLVVVLVAGCGGSDTQEVEAPDAMMTTGLRNFAEMYRLYSITNKKPPKSFEELRTMEEAMPGGLAGAGPATIEVFWGATLPDLGEEPGGVESDKVLAYDKNVPQSGGNVLMLDRTVKTMTAEEFQTAPKAGTLPAGGAAAKK